MALEARIKNRLRRELVGELQWGDIVQAFQATDNLAKQRIVSAAKEGRNANVAREFMRIVRVHVETKVQSEYDTIMADGSLSVAELERLFP